MTWSALRKWMQGKGPMFAVCEGRVQPIPDARRYVGADTLPTGLILTPDAAKAERIAERQRAQIARRS